MNRRIFAQYRISLCVARIREGGREREMKRDRGRERKGEGE